MTQACIFLMESSWWTFLPHSCISCTDLSLWSPKYLILITHFVKWKLACLVLFNFLALLLGEKKNTICVSCSPLLFLIIQHVNSHAGKLVIRFFAFPFIWDEFSIYPQCYCTLLLQTLSSLKSSAFMLDEGKWLCHCLPGWAVLCVGFLFFPPHLPCTICLPSTKGRLYWTNPIASFDKIADFLVKRNALDITYLDFSNAFEMG